ncbi:MAG: ABC transporter permease subunit [Rhizobiaceae bacterium]|nr:ABC transporter permease subunit [Rhizobiaceae bacterium]
MAVLLEYGPLVLSGLETTVLLSLVSLLIAILLGILGAVAKLSRHAVLRGVGEGYTALVRGIPDLVLMLIIFFGGQTAVNELGFRTGLWDYVEISAFWAGAGTIGLIFGAYMTETFRGAYRALSVGQLEAAQAVGFSRLQTFIHVILPQIIPLALPSFTNNWLVLLKTTALVSIIGLQDVMYNANQAGRSSQEPFLFLILAFFIYLTLTLVSDAGLKLLARRYGAETR